MGCGKSSVGRRLSELLCCRFVDLDNYIEEKAGRTIPEIFAGDGEGAFRQMELQALSEILVQEGLERVPKPPTTTIISLGGGTVVTPGCAELVREKTCCIYLRTSVETLVERLENEAEGRPMLASGQNADKTEGQDAETLKDQDAETLKVRKSALRERIETLIAKRSSTYEATAHHVIDTDGLSIDTISRTVIHLLDTTNI